MLRCTENARDARSDDFEDALDSTVHPFDEAMVRCTLSARGHRGQSEGRRFSFHAWMLLVRFPFIVWSDCCTNYPLA